MHNGPAALQPEGCSGGGGPEVVLTAGPGLGLGLEDIIAVCRMGRPVTLDPSPAFVALLEAGPDVLKRKLEAGVSCGPNKWLCVVGGCR